MSPLSAQSGHYRLSSNVRFWGYVAVPMAALPDEVNLYEATILPNSMRSFIGRGKTRPVQRATKS